MKQPRLICLGLAVAASFLTACASKPTTTAEKPAAPKEEYVSYTPTGSWISKKVKKSAVTTSEQETAEAQMALGELQRRGNQTKRTE
jgi:hypothetical protein